jgi:hypothetical protein
MPPLEPRRGIRPLSEVLWVQFLRRTRGSSLGEKNEVVPRRRVKLLEAWRVVLWVFKIGVGELVLGKRPPAGTGGLESHRGEGGVGG